jgi:serine/threonine protein phosphatase 1
MTAPGVLPPGLLLYAVGDIHGRADLLDRLLELILEDAADAPAQRLSLVFLGDYIDRGPDSRAVLERLRRLRDADGPDVCCLRGNHEQALLDFLADPAAGPAWVRYGGDAALLSYGETAPRGASAVSPQCWEDCCAALVHALPPADLAFLHSLPLSHVAGGYLFVHAGVRPKVALDAQSNRDLLTIREPFLSWGGALERVVVHGHTPAERPYDGPWRIGVDTGAYASGRLTAVRLCGSERRFLST